ncbi:MAG: hypothetical protein U9Q03_01690 [Patescibacteria group bacterium]|nr:hypothetical protein [Patescibacteria group bacterium]
METQRIVVGGPSHSGKSSWILSAVERMFRLLSLTAHAVELDVWSESYPAFQGRVAFEERPKHTGLDWDWKTPLDERLREFNGADGNVVFGDMPGAYIDEATVYMCRNADASGAIVISATLEGMKAWRDFFGEQDIPVLHEFLTTRGPKPFVLGDFGRMVDPHNADVAFLTGQVAFDGMTPDDLQQEADDRFRQIFMMNVMHRSRTLHGADENLDRPFKKQLELSGRPLMSVARRNCKALVDDVLSTPRPDEWGPVVFRQHCERWFDLVNRRINGPQWYRQEFGRLQRQATYYGRVQGRAANVNPRYRIWTPAHTVTQVHPLLLEDQMDIFYGRLADLMVQAEEHHPSWHHAIEAMAYADLMIDGELRPWIDGCGRIATALVMWVARMLGVPQPLFAENKEVHRMTYRDMDDHIQYLLERISCAEEECP